MDIGVPDKTHTLFELLEPDGDLGNLMNDVIRPLGINAHRALSTRDPQNRRRAVAQTSPSRARGLRLRLTRNNTCGASLHQHDAKTCQAKDTLHWKVVNAEHFVQSEKVPQFRCWVRLQGRVVSWASKGRTCAEIFVLDVFSNNDFCNAWIVSTRRGRDPSFAHQRLRLVPDAEELQTCRGVV